jgi:predicted dehydrogenase
MARGQKRIGFVDNNLDNFHSNTYLKLLRNDLKKEGFVVGGGSGLAKRQSQLWAKENKVAYFQTAAELNACVDYFMILAPSDPEKHLELCRSVFPFGKPTYVDKTFAPDVKTARQIFASADRHKVPMQTTSALRYSGVQDYVAEVGRKNVRHMVTWGGGRSFDEYAIHPLEMAISCMGPGVRRVMRRGVGKQSQLLLDFSGGRTAVVNVYTNARTPYAASVTTTEGTKHIQVDSSQIFLNTARAVLEMFKKRRPNIDRKESLVIRRIQDVAGQKRAEKGFVKI